MAAYPCRLDAELRSKLQQRIEGQTLDPSLIRACQAQAIYDLSELDATRDEILAALNLPGPDLRAAILKVRARASGQHAGHPLRFRLSQMPQARRNDAGQLVWISTTRLVETAIALDDAISYARARLAGVPDNGSALAGIFGYLESEARQLLDRKARNLDDSHPIHGLEALDLVLFAIDAAASEGTIVNFFRIQDYFSEALEMYYDKVNA